MSELPALPEGIEAKDYWVIQAKGLAALWLIKKIMQPLEHIKMEEQPVVMFPFNNATAFMLSKKYISVERVMKYTGMSRQAIEEKEIIKIEEPGVANLPSPTVNYWGEA